MQSQTTGRDAGVVDRGGLENRCTLTGTQGSNPCLSANDAERQQTTRSTPNFALKDVKLGVFALSKKAPGNTESWRMVINLCLDITSYICKKRVRWRRILT